jgi:hypothetical protein
MSNRNRRQSRTDPVPSGTTYNRNKDRKHRNRQYDQQ